MVASLKSIRLTKGSQWSSLRIGVISHSQVVSISYNFAMRCLWCSWYVYEVYEKSMWLTDKSVQKRPHRNILTCPDVARWSRSPTDLSIRSMSLLENSVLVKYNRYTCVLYSNCYSTELFTGYFSWTRPDPTRPVIADKMSDPDRVMQLNWLYFCGMCQTMIYETILIEVLCAS